jgi:4-aminobutyrate aminotransferase-like enzyme
VLRLQPPLSITSQQLDQFVAALRNTLRTVRGS